RLAGPIPMVASKPALSSILTVSGPALGWLPSHTLMSSRQSFRFWLRLPLYRSAVGDLACTQLLSLPIGLLWLTFHLCVKMLNQASSSTMFAPASSDWARYWYAPVS